MDRNDRHPREDLASGVTGHEPPTEALGDTHGSARQAASSDRQAANVTLDSRKQHGSVKSDTLQESLDEGLEESFPGSDPVSSTRRS